MTALHAVVIAGGAGSRLGGVRKGDLLVGRQRLLDRIVAGLGALSTPLLVATGPAGSELRLPPDALSVPDQAGEHLGPLAGIIASLDVLKGRGVCEGVLVSVAVDTPFLPQDFVSRLGGALDGADAAFAGWGQAFYPTNAAWRIERVKEALQGAEPPNSPKALQRLLGARRVDWSADFALDPFANVNTIGDLLALQRRLRP